VHAPNAITTQVHQRYKPDVAAWRFKHYEFVQNIYGSDMFAVTGYRINPADKVTFPWLSQIAPNFETYSFVNLKYWYSTASSTTQGGKVLMAIDYDASDAAPADKASMLQYEGALDTAPWLGGTLKCSVGKLARLPRYFTATQPSTDVATKRQQDAGTLWIAVEETTDDAFIGELWVEYEIMLYTPQAAGGCMGQDLSFSSATTVSTSGTSVTVDWNAYDKTQTYFPGPILSTSASYPDVIVVQETGNFRVEILYLLESVIDLTTAVSTSTLLLNGEPVAGVTSEYYHVISPDAYGRVVWVSTWMQLTSGDLLTPYLVDVSGDPYACLSIRFTVLEANTAAFPDVTWTPPLITAMSMAERKARSRYQRAKAGMLAMRQPDERKEEEKGDTVSEPCLGDTVSESFASVARS
jgi:hypothetical protein